MNVIRNFEKSKRGDFESRPVFVPEQVCLKKLLLCIHDKVIMSYGRMWLDLLIGSVGHNLDFFEFFIFEHSLSEDFY